jgi:radical SAM-linked protein
MTSWSQTEQGQATIDPQGPAIRLRITFAKTAAMRYTSHLDLHRTWERTIRRAGLPLAYSHGYNPRPRIQIAAALPLGFTSQHEIVDVWFEDPLEIHEVLEALEKAVPPGVKIIEISQVDLRSPALQTQKIAADYIITFLEPVPHIGARVEVLRSAERLPRQRRGKDYDLRPLVEEIHPLPDDEDGQQRIHMRLALREGATGRPEEVLLAMGIQPELARVHRECIIFVE